MYNSIYKTLYNSEPLLKRKSLLIHNKRKPKGVHRNN